MATVQPTDDSPPVPHIERARAAVVASAAGGRAPTALVGACAALAPFPANVIAVAALVWYVWDRKR